MKPTQSPDHTFDFGIIIPFQKVSDYLYETLDAIAELVDASFEVILLPDEPIESTVTQGRSFPIRSIPTGPVSPAIKRDMGVEQSNAEYVAFIDDDAYPAANWLQNAKKYFSDENVAAVGGPQVTPEHDDFWQRVSGAMFLSPLNGRAVCRYMPCPDTATPEEVDDWPSVNLIVRSDDFTAVGGFDSTYWPGEDTKLCLDLIKKLGKKILYAPDAVVFHHRRSGFRKHMKQIGNYGLHRGYFAKAHPETSFRLSYFIPSCFFLFVVLGFAAQFMSGTLAFLYKATWVLYLACLAYSSFVVSQRAKDWRIGLATAPYLLGTHFWYGGRFLLGFFLKRNLQSKLGR